MILNIYSRLKRIVLPLVLICAMLNGCAEKSSRDIPEEISIGVCVHDDYETFVMYIVEDMKLYAKEREKETGIKFKIDVVSANDNQITQNDQVHKFIQRNYDVICVNIVDRTDTSVIIDEAISNKVPIIFFNREIVKEDLNRWDKLYYVGGVAEQSARLQAKLIIDALSDKETFDKIDVNGNDTIQYVILEGDKRHQDTIVRTDLVPSLLAQEFKIEKLGDEYADWNRDLAKSKMLSLIYKYPFQIEMVIANNDEMALGAIDAISESNYPNPIFIVGIDGTKDGLEAIRTGKLDGSVNNDDEGQARAIMDIAEALAKDEPIPEDVQLTFGKYDYLPYSIITYDNVQEYIK